MKRIGDCPPSVCQGRCCESIGTWFPKNDESRDYMELLQTSGRVQVLEVDDHYLARDNRPCQWLTEDKLCALHPDIRTEDLPPRPSLCDAFPQEPSQILLHPECGFRFTDE